ncbi:MAG: ribose-phosphate pyrophosphokinase [Candidatus Nitrosocaldus sp.]|nr:ribose-phosphate pyrophosphokinase [Candidatus Nitrosocaldus sp.]MDW8000999.1 ribose-phosphate pyrophosphokinase [Candidatus Nitrosocaldus sp.]
MGTSVLAGPASRDIAKSIAVALEARLVDVDLRIFPDGESKIRITGPMEGDDVIVVQSTHPPVDTHMMQLFFMLSRVSRIASRVIALVPYLGYARQDREFLAGEVVSMDTIARIISSYGIDALITVDAHSTLALSYFTIPVYNLSAVPLLAGYFKDRLRGEGVDADDVVSVSPDAGGAGRAEAFAGVIGCSHLALRKSRDRTTGSISIDHDMLKGISDHLRGKVAVVVDDMISTGSSVAEAVRALLEYGCRRVYVTCTHALMLDGALERIRGSGASAIVSTNTVPRGVGGLTVEVDVAPLAASALLSILMGRSGMDGMDREGRGEEGSKEGSKSISSV